MTIEHVILHMCVRAHECVSVVSLSVYSIWIGHTDTQVLPTTITVATKSTTMELVLSASVAMAYFVQLKIFHCIIVDVHCDSFVEHQTNSSKMVEWWPLQKVLSFFLAYALFWPFSAMYFWQCLNNNAGRKQ